MVAADGRSTWSLDPTQVRMAGFLASYFHHDHALAAVVEFRCADGLTAKDPELCAIAHDIALHVAVANPSCVGPDYVDLDLWNREVNSHRSELLRLRGDDRDDFLTDLRRRFEQRHVLLQQLFVKDETRTVGDILAALSKRLNEDISIARFSRFDVREI
jgi:elongation factor Ts